MSQKTRTKIHPALKHGAYSALALLPGEDKTAFEKLHQDVMAELSPNGLLEEDAVETITALVLRKKNLHTLHKAQLARNHYDAAIRATEAHIASRLNEVCLDRRDLEAKAHRQLAEENA